MSPKEFIELNLGKWFSLRTSYQLKDEKTDNQKCELSIDLLPIDDMEVQKLCKQFQVSPTSTLGGIKTTWDNAVDSDKPRQQGHTLLVMQPENDNEGVLLQLTNSPNTLSLSGTYVLGEDQALTLTINHQNNQWQERLWFASPNLRLRSSFVSSTGGFTTFSFYSEIRRISASPVAPT